MEVIVSCRSDGLTAAGEPGRPIVLRLIFRPALDIDRWRFDDLTQSRDTPTSCLGGTHMFDVELDIFSGRPNPRWSLSAAEEAELVERLLDRSVPMAPMTISDG